MLGSGLNTKATGSAPAIVLRTLVPIMKCLGILDDEAKGAWSSLFAVASNEFTRSNSGSYIVPYAKIGTPSSAATDAELANKLWGFTHELLNSKGFLAD